MRAAQACRPCFSHPIVNSDSDPVTRAATPVAGGEEDTTPPGLPACAGGATSHDPSTGARVDQGGTSPEKVGRGRGPTAPGRLSTQQAAFLGPTRTKAWRRRTLGRTSRRARWRARWPAPRSCSQGPAVIWCHWPAMTGPMVRPAAALTWSRRTRVAGRAALRDCALSSA